MRTATKITYHKDFQLHTCIFVTKVSSCLYRAAR